MKKLLIAIGLLGSLTFFHGKVNAAAPLEQMLTPRTQYNVFVATPNPPSPIAYPLTGTWNTLISSSVVGIAGSATTMTLPVVQATVTFNNGVSNSTFTARNCITDLTVSLSAGSTFYLLDGNTTSYTIYGISMLPSTTTTVVQWNKHWDHLGPYCGTAGNALTLQIPAPTTSNANNAINAEGYSVITGLAAVYNAGQ